MLAKGGNYKCQHRHYTTKNTYYPTTKVIEEYAHDMTWKLNAFMVHYDLNVSVCKNQAK